MSSVAGCVGQFGYNGCTFGLCVPAPKLEFVRPSCVCHVVSVAPAGMLHLNECKEAVLVHEEHDRLTDECRLMYVPKFSEDEDIYVVISWADRKSVV